MTTHFIEAEINLNSSPAKLHQEIENTLKKQLKKQGEPLRWAVTNVKEQKARVEAIVTVKSE
jgi:hypothetical protein